MYQPTDLKKGTVCQIDGKPYRVIEYGQKVMGRGGSIVNVKLKNLIDGSVIPKTFKGQDKIEPAEVTNKKVQYLYHSGDSFNFMDPESFEQFELSSEIVGEEGCINPVQARDQIVLDLIHNVGAHLAFAEGPL